MKYEEQEVFVVKYGPTHTSFRVFDSRGDAVRFAGGHSELVIRKKVVQSSGRGPYRKPWVPIKKKRGKKNASR